MSTPQEPVGKAVRLLFTYQQGTVRLVSQRRVDVAVTGSDTASHLRSGEFVEVRDATGARLSRVPIHTALDTSIEVFPDTPGGPITRVAAPDLKRAFTVVVPARTTAASVAVLRIGRLDDETPTGHPADPSLSRGPGSVPLAASVTELASFPLDHTPET